MSDNIKIIKGNIFNTKAQTIVNTVNCVGVMGKGIALVFMLLCGLKILPAPCCGHFAGRCGLHGAGHCGGAAGL